MLQISWGIALIQILVSCVLAILLHECSHALAARLLGISLYAVRPSAVGIRARLKGNTRSFKKQTLIFLAGPLGNFILAAIFHGSEGFLKSLYEANLAIGIFNLLPMYPLDGGQVFIILSYKIAGSNVTFKLIKRLSLIIKIFLVLMGFIQVVFFGNPSLLIAAVILPGTRLLEETVSMMKLENLLNRKQRIISKGVYGARHIMVMDDCTLGDVLQKLDYDKFHIIYVMNHDMDIIGQITEQHIIKAIQTCSPRDKICDVFFLGL